MSENDFKKRVNFLLKDMSGHVLVPLLNESGFCAYKMWKPGTNILSTLITFTPCGIVLQGDITPERNGSVSCLGYGERWFSGELSPDYLAEKFLRKKWVPDEALDKFRWFLDEMKENGDATPSGRIVDDDLISEAFDYLGEAENQWEAIEYFAELIGSDNCLDIDWYSYDPAEQVVLCGIQKKFAELKKVPEVKTEAKI
eukprot:TRINITY_DN31148_c0_g1_i1.p4 TRINITY_DN31148_c0_g1~~TRINITY_DN31148_c0_g1_i1.p4  ORF type:complete len:199 (+),score=35.37 TRINITY_DN31148_c0_g1_i1:1431-2027(+)